LFVPLVAHFGLGRPVARATWIGVALAIVGMAVMTRPFDGAVTPAMRVGDALTIGCAVAFAAHIVWTAEWSTRHALAPLLFVQVLVVTAGSLVLAAFEPRQVGPRGELVAIVVYTGVVMTAGAFFVQTWAQRHTTAVRAALIFSLEPVAAALFAWWLGGDRIAAAEWIGGAVIVGGVLLGELTPRGTPASGAR
jgi:drug/metabolite transporter (DMT)-like permease